MRAAGVTVLKFGGSVLTSELTLRLAVHEIYRWRREGEQVVAVVSALAGVTDALLAQCSRCSERPTDWAAAALVSSGEMQSAALLGLHLDRAGVSATVCTPEALGLTAEGAALDAWPVRLRTGRLESALAQYGVVVVPGYVACAADGRTCLMGRGGSDLTALFLAHVLGAARCRLIKDVDGLYEADPAQPGPQPRRYATATWDDALATDGAIVHHKAVRLAAQHGIAFELGRLNATRPTQIGRGPTVLEEGGMPRPPLRVALLGHGTVGAGVRALLEQLHSLFEVAGIAVRDVATHVRAGLPAVLLTDDPVALAGRDADIVVEVMGGCDAAGVAVEAALRRGVHVVTANKALMAERGAALTALAKAHGCRLRFAAAVGGSMPLLEVLAAGAARGMRSMRAVLNGTTNFVLERVTEAEDLAGAVRATQARGFAEADPARDLSGQDAADKLAVAGLVLGGPWGARVAIEPEALTADTLRSARRALRDGQVLRHLATLDRTNGAVQAAVRLRAVDVNDPLATVRAEQNAAVVTWTDGTHTLVRGIGAGRWPTAEAVVADVLEIARCVGASDATVLKQPVAEDKEGARAR
jgi:homoserine dehydrogenase